MSTRRIAIRLTRDLDQMLRRQYKQWRIPRGQLKSHPDYLDAFTEEFNGRAGTNFASSEILHYIDTQQKITARLEEPWPTFAGAHKVLPPVANVFTHEHLAVLKGLWREHIMPLNLGTDGFAYRDNLVELLASRFEKATKLKVPGMILAARIETERKHGNWLCLKNAGFDDLDLIA